MTRLPPSVPFVVLASAPWRSVAPVNCHHLATRLARRGHRVLFVESTGLRSPSPLRSGHDRGRVARRVAGWLRGPRQVRPGLWVFSPLALPWGWDEPWRTRSLAWLGAQTARAARRLALHRPVLWAQLPTGWTTAQRVSARCVVYHCADDYTANPGVDPAWVAAQEARLLEAADRVFAASPSLGDRLRARRPDTEVLPNVADVGLFARALRNPGPPPSALASVARPRAVYMGNISTYKVDMHLLAGLAQTLPWLQLVLVGEVGMGDTADARAALRTLRERDNVHILPARAPEALPGLLAACDVALIPFVSNGHTRSSLPLKLWEYMAAGLPVVARDLPNLRGLAPAWAIRLADAPGVFASQVEKALQEPGGRREDRLALARSHDWDARIETILERLAEPGAGS